MTNPTDTILRSEVYDMVKNKIKSYIDVYGLGTNRTSGLEDILFELSQIESVNEWIPEVGETYFVGDGETKGKLLGFRFEFESGTIDTIHHKNIMPLPPTPNQV